LGNGDIGMMIRRLLIDKQLAGFTGDLQSTRKSSVRYDSLLYLPRIFARFCEADLKRSVMLVKRGEIMTERD